MKFKYRYRVVLPDGKVHLGWSTESSPAVVVKTLFKRFDEAISIYVEEESQEEDDLIGEGE